jgi:hypothetical protein
VKKTSSDKVFIPDYALVKVKQMGHIVAVRHSSHVNYKASIKKLDKDRYIDVQTGEIKNFNHIENRQQSYNSLRKTFSKLSDLINNNFTGKGNELHVTLTYKENMTDPKRLYSDFKRFMTRLRRKYKDKSSIDYICVVEPQERGAWHCHLLLRFNDLDKVFLSNNLVRELWEQGKIVKTKSLKDVDNVGAYLSAYLTDVELTEDNVMTVSKEHREIVVKQVDGKEKKFIKGGRLHLYPPGMNLYRKSKGIVTPEEGEMSFREVKKIVGAATPHYQKAITITDDNDFEVTHQYIQYNTKRNTE